MAEYKLTIKDSIKEGVLIGRLEKEIGADFVIQSISYLLIRLQDSLNTKHKMNAGQVLRLSLDILESYKYETIEDIILMLKNARKGVFGKSYNKIDSETIFTTWMPQYLEMKAEERERLHRERKKGTIQATPEALKVWTETKKAIEEQNIKNQKEKIKEEKKIRSHWQDQIDKLEKSKNK